MKYIVDVQGFKEALNEFVFKELSVVPLENDAIPSVFLFKPPCRWDKLLRTNQCENRWLELNYHGILWQSGDIPYTDLGRILGDLLYKADVYVKGLEKTKWLQRILCESVVHNIEDLGCPSLKKLPIENVPCTNHTRCMNAVCAYRNTLAMKRWMLEEYLTDDSISMMYT